MVIDIENFVFENPVFDNRYKMLEPLSSDGGTADVWVALDLNTVDEVYDEDSDNVGHDETTGLKVAIKIYKPKSALDAGEQRFRDEFKIVFNCHHSNLLQPINFSIFKGMPYLVLPYCENGSAQMLQGQLTQPDDMWKFIADVSGGLAYLHGFDPQIVHHDIKPGNILVDDNRNYLITDFGISANRGNAYDRFEESQSGTIAYMAPERFEQGYNSSPESDIWAFGATLYEMIMDRMPYGEEGGKNQMQQSLRQLQIRDDVPEPIKKLITDCLDINPAKRPTAEQIHKAALAQEYPLKKKSNLGLILGSAAAAAVVVAAVLIFVLGGKKSAPVLTNEEAYEQVKAGLSSTSPRELRRALAVMDSLGGIGYVPALYETAYTYGWYSDPESVQRKDVLGIEYSPSDAFYPYLPSSRDVNQKAIGIFTRIKEIDDPDYPEINANALYRLGCYYMNGAYVPQNLDYAKELFDQALDWAQEYDDTKLSENIYIMLSNIEEYVKRTKQGQ